MINFSSQSEQEFEFEGTVHLSGIDHQLLNPILGNENSSRDEPFDLTFDVKSQKNGRLIKISGINLLEPEEITISGNVIVEIFKSDIKVATNINSILYNSGNALLKEIDFLSYPNVEFRASASENFKRWRVSNIILKKNKSFILIDGDILLTFRGQFGFPKLFNEIEVKTKIEEISFAKLLEFFPVCTL